MYIAILPYAAGSLPASNPVREGHHRALLRAGDRRFYASGDLAVQLGRGIVRQIVAQRRH